MTRLGIDAHGEQAWRDKGFFPVLRDPADPDAFPSALVALLELGRANPVPGDRPLPKEVDLDLKRQLACPAPAELADYRKDHPLGGMPYGMAALAGPEYDRLIAWAKSGASLPEKSEPIPQPIAEKIASIEAFLNNKDLRQQLVARYLYEHLFLAHLHIEGTSAHRFFKLIRSKTPAGQPPIEIPTRRPFDDPGGPFTYRIVPIDGTILHKEHVVYEIGPQRLQRYQDLFFDADWVIDRLPPYSSSAGGNPFSTFEALPAKGRYQFLLDDALFFVRSFIRGPVCYGQVAVNVIEDRFWVSFMDPDADLSVQDADYLKKITPLLDLPVALSDKGLEDRFRSFLDDGPIEYAKLRDAEYRSNPAFQGGPAYPDVWDGDGENDQAHLTVFRNFDNASVITGFAGGTPETAWVIDFPLFERIYYDLVAGFDVFGNVEHQLTTRFYMDSLRREGERNFLAFMPPDVRETYHDRWYHGPLVTVLDWVREQPLDTTTPTGIGFQTRHPKAEFLETLLERGNGLWPVEDPINRCSAEECAASSSMPGKLRPLASMTAPFVRFMPDLSVLIVTSGTEEPGIFTLVHNKAHSNVAFLFREDDRREPGNDTMTIVPGQFGSYPNFYFKVAEDRLDAFVQSLAKVANKEDYLDFIKTYGVRRADSDFWATTDTVQAALNTQNALQAGLLDLNRYKDP
ncbi:peptidylprolyl isomerase [Roseibium sp. RKSG952]|nr:peptidylprolyl isomerase [Roseibium sp. RKSG952]